MLCVYLFVLPRLKVILQTNVIPLTWSSKQSLQTPTVTTTSSTCISLHTLVLTFSQRETMIIRTIQIAQMHNVAKTPLVHDLKSQAS